MSAPPTRSTGGNHHNESLRLQLLPARAFFLLPLPQPDTWAPAVLVADLFDPVDILSAQRFLNGDMRVSRRATKATAMAVEKPMQYSVLRTSLSIVLGIAITLTLNLSSLAA
jgi:hypothetical protein